MGQCWEKPIGSREFTAWRIVQRISNEEVDWFADASFRPGIFYDSESECSMSYDEWSICQWEGG
jgi:hypothetical protein